MRLACGGRACCDPGMRIVLACVVLLITDLGSRSAGASCMRPRGGFSPPSGTVMPAKATVYLFVPRLHKAMKPIDLEVRGASFVAREIGVTAIDRVVRIDLVAGGPELSIRWAPKDDAARGPEALNRWLPEDAERGAEVTYPVGTPDANRATVIDVGHTKYGWTCSHQDTIDLTMTGNAVAYRLEWSDGVSTLLPANESALWGVDEDSQSQSSHTLEIGYMNCIGSRVDLEALATLREVELLALFSDGSERRLGLTKMKLERMGVRLPWELLHAAVAVVPSARPDPDEPRVKELGDPVWPAWLTLGALAGTGSVALAGLAWLAHRRSDYLLRNQKPGG